MKSARIWICHRDSFVKIRVTSWKETVIEDCGATDEGFYRRVESYYMSDDGETIISETTCSESDCDGRHSSHGIYSWPVGGPTKAAFIDWGPRDENGHSTDIYDESVQLPQWSRVTSNQRDYSAEAMGY